MGRKKEKVRWTSVDKGFFAQNDSSMKIENDSSFNLSHCRPLLGPNNSQSYNRKQSWTNGGFAPRFERKGSESLDSSVQDFEGKGQKGFFTIRSRSHLCMNPMFQTDIQEGAGDDQVESVSYGSIEEDDSNHLVSICCITSDPYSHEAIEHQFGSWEANSHTYEEIDVQSNSTKSHERSNISPSTIEFDNSTLKTEEESLEDRPAPQSEIDPDIYQEDTEQKEDSEFPGRSIINENASPFYPNSYISPPLPPMFMEHPSENHLTLYLYTPGTQAAVPCDEIVITSPLIAPDGSTLFPSPSNVCLPYDGMVNRIEFLGHQATPCRLIHCDQYGNPFTTYGQPQPLMSLMLSGREESVASPLDSEGITTNSSVSHTDCSVESTPNSPPALLEYPSGNWNETKTIEPDESPQEFFYQQETWSSDVLYSKNIDPNVFYQSQGIVFNNAEDGYWTPASTGGSLAEEEDESQNRVVFSGAKNESGSMDGLKMENKELPAQRLILGLPDNLAGSTAKKIQKKKKKISDASSTTQTDVKNLTYKVRGNLNISPSKKDLSQIDARDTNNFQLNSPLPQVDVFEAEIANVQGPVGSNIVEVSKESQAKPKQHRRSDEEGQRHRILEDTNQILMAAPGEVKKATQGEVQIINDDQWEIVPNEIKESMFDVWETSKGGKRSRKGGRQFQVRVPVPEIYRTDNSFQIQRGDESLHQQDEPSKLCSNEPQLDPKNLRPEEVEKSEEKYTKPIKIKVHPEQHLKEGLRADKPKFEIDPSNKIFTINVERKITEQPQDLSNPEDKLDRLSQTSGSSASVSSITSSIVTSKNKRKKRSARVENKIGQNVKQVLVHDGIVNFADGMAGSCRLLNKPNDLINEHAFILKDIGHGMRVGPMGTGRINQSNYQPPDMSAEILLQFMKQQRGARF